METVTRSLEGTGGCSEVQKWLHGCMNSYIRICMYVTGYFTVLKVNEHATKGGEKHEPKILSFTASLINQVGALKIILLELWIKIVY